MADSFYPAAQYLQNPDILGAYVRGQMAPLQVAGAQQGLQLGQQELAQGQQRLQGGALSLEQMRLALQFQRWKQGVLSNAIAGETQTNGAQDIGGQSGGIQNGPQGSVSSQSSGQPSMSGSYDGSVGGDTGGGWGNTPNLNAGGFNLSPASLRMVRALDPEMVKGYTAGQEAALKAAQLQASMPGSPLSILKGFAGNPQADRALMNNPRMLSLWPQMATKYGVDPTQFNALNVRRVATMAANEQLSALQMTPLPMPEHFTTAGTGFGGEEQIKDITGQRSQVLPRVEPVKVGETQDANGNTVAVYHQFIGGPGGGAGKGAAAGGGGASPNTNVTVGRPIPSTENAKAVGFASSMRRATAAIDKIEGTGYHLEPSDRAVFINVASDENPGLLHQWLSQEILAHKLTPQAQTYISAAMPMIQALSHDQSGARLNSSQIRANLESAIPIDTNNQENMKQVQGFRQDYYKSMLIGSGSAAYTPEFNATLGADRRKFSGQGMPGMDEIAAEIARRRKLRGQ